MIKILIVDDEKNIRGGIHKILRETIAFDILYLEAKNGIEALEIIEKENPELVITDIRMPKMDGLELMKQISLRTITPEIIVLSGYDEFAYAKESIKYRVVSYILKPVDRNELISVVSGIISVIERRKKSTVEQIIQRIMSEGRMIRTLIPGDFSFEPPFYFIFITGLEKNENLSFITEKKTCYVLEKKNDSICLLVHEEEKKLLEHYQGSENMRIGISLICASLANLRTAWRQAALVSFSRFFDNNSRVYQYKKTTTALERTSFDTQIQKIITLIGSGEAEGITAVIENLFVFDSITAENKKGYLFILHDFITMGVIKKYWENTDADMYLTLKSIMIENIHQFKSIDEYKKTVLDFVLYLNNVLKKEHIEYPFIDQALEYIKTHFTDDINMTIVANHVSINYTYFSEKFKEHTGGNFNDYLKNIRIAEAKRLLQKGCYKVYEVATNSGFGDVKYFMKTFKETTGLTPGEYKKQF